MTVQLLRSVAHLLGHHQEPVLNQAFVFFRNCFLPAILARYKLCDRSPCAQLYCTALILDLPCYFSLLPAFLTCFLQGALP